MASLFPSLGRQVPGYNTARWDLAMGNLSQEKEQAFCTQLLLQLSGSGSIPASLQPSPVSVGAGCRRQPSCLTRSDCSSSPWHKRHRKDFCSRHRVCLVVRKTVPPTLSLTHLAWVPADGGVSQVQRSPTAPCISSPPSILILNPSPPRPPPACRDCRRCCLPGNAGICSLSAFPSAAALFPGGQGPPCDHLGGPEGEEECSVLEDTAAATRSGQNHSSTAPMLPGFSPVPFSTTLWRCRVLCKNRRHLFP